MAVTNILAQKFVKSMWKKASTSMRIVLIVTAVLMRKRQNIYGAPDVPNRAMMVHVLINMKENMTSMKNMRSTGKEMMIDLFDQDKLVVSTSLFECCDLPVILFKPTVEGMW